MPVSTLPPDTLEQKYEVAVASLRSAHDEIDELNARIAKLRGALEIIAGSADLLQATQAKGALANI